MLRKVRSLHYMEATVPDCIVQELETVIATHSKVRSWSRLAVHIMSHKTIASGNAR